ncbi:MAG: VOC family protein [Candidatus Thiodiazotropha taylori]
MIKECSTHAISHYRRTAIRRYRFVMKQCFIDHITITAPTLEAGAGLVEKYLGLIPQKGGEHPRMGTHSAS